MDNPIYSIKELKLKFELGAYYKVYKEETFDIFKFTGYEPPRGYVIGKGEKNLSEILSEFVYLEFLGHELD